MKSRLGPREKKKKNPSRLKGDGYRVQRLENDAKTLREMTSGNKNAGHCEKGFCLQQCDIEWKWAL